MSDSDMPCLTLFAIIHSQDEYDNKTSAPEVAMDENQKWNQLVSHLINGPLTAVTVVVGVALNILSMLLLKYTRSATSRYLSGLALWHTTLLISGFFMYSLPMLIYGRLPWIGSYVYIYIVAFTASNTAVIGCIWVLLSFCIERYVALIWPLFHTRQCWRASTPKVVLLVSAIAIIVGLPRAFELTIYHCAIKTNESANHRPDTTPLIAMSQVGLDGRFILFYRVIGGLLTTTLVPYTTLLVLTVRVLFHVHKVRQRPHGPWSIEQRQLRRKSTERRRYRAEMQRRHLRSDYMLLWLILKFLVTNLSPTVLDVLEHVMGHQRYTEIPMLGRAVDVSNLLVMLNAASNFFVYLLCSRSFSHHSRRLFCQFWLGPSDGTFTEAESRGRHSTFTGFGSTKPTASPRSARHYNLNGRVVEKEGVSVKHSYSGIPRPDDLESRRGRKRNRSMATLPPSSPLLMPMRLNSLGFEDAIEDSDESRL